MILGGLNEVVWSARWPDLDLILISPSIERLVGYQSKEFLERPQLWRGCFSRTDWNRLKEASTRILEEQVIDMEIHIVTASQRKKRVRLRTRIIKDDDGIPVRIASSLTPLEALDDLPVLPRVVSYPYNELNTIPKSNRISHQFFWEFQ